MLIQRVTDRKGKTIGVVLHWRSGADMHTHSLAPTPRTTLWKVCQLCTDNEALVYCRVHSVYLCLECLLNHELMSGCKFIGDQDGRPCLVYTDDLLNRCEYLSRAAARALAV